MSKTEMVFFNKNVKINHLYFIVYECIDEIYLKLLKEYSYDNLFFDLVLTSDPKNIKYYLSKIKINSIIPATKIVEIYTQLTENNKEYCILNKKNKVWDLTNEVVFEDLIKYKISKDQIMLFIDMLEMVRSKQIEPIYIPLKDEEKEKSFI